MVRFRQSVVFAILVFVPLAAQADALDAYVREQMRQLHLPGVAVAVVRDGSVVTMRSYGSADLESDVPVTPDTVFELGSVTKQFTAIAVMMLVEEGKIGLDESIARYLPRVPEPWRAITVRHLLTHSSGIQEYLSVPGLPDRAHDAASHDEMTQTFFRDLKLEFEPGETWSYSNTGYLLLGNIIERVSGRSYWEFLHDRIFGPLGMTATRSSDPGALIRRRATGYGWKGNRFEQRPALSENAYSAGAIVSTLRDMTRWDAALHNGKLISRRGYERIWTPLTLNGGATPPFSYGFGWVIDRERGQPVVLHSGGTPGFSSAFRRYRKSGLSVIVLTNHGDRILDHVALDIAGIILPSLARDRTKIDPHPELSASLRNAFQGLLNGSPDAKLFTPEMQAFLATANGKGLWQWLGSHGELKFFSYAGTERAEKKNSILRYEARLGEIQTWLSFTITEKGEIAQVYWW